MNPQVWWFVARSSGIVAWALLTVAVIWGLLLSTPVSATRVAARRLRPAWLLDLHRHLAGLAVIFTAVHLVGLVADSYVTFGWAEILLPMASAWKPGAVAFGVVSMYLLVAIEATSLAIRRLPRGLWRWVHRSSFVLFATATYHGIAAGSDAGNTWFRAAAWMSVVTVAALTIRLLVTSRRRAAAVAAFGAELVVPAASPPVSPVVPSGPPGAPSVVPAAPPPVPLVATIPPLPGSVVELAMPAAAPFVPPAPAVPRSPFESVAAGPPPPSPPPSPSPPPPPESPPPPPPPPSPMRTPVLHDPEATRAMAGVSPGGNGADGLGPPTAAT